MSRWALAFAIFPSQIAYQDIAALLASQPAVTQSWNRHVIASPFGTIHAATFSFPRPIGTAIPQPPLYDLTSTDIDRVTRDASGAPIELPSVNRNRKGDALASRPRPSVPVATPADDENKSKTDQAADADVDLPYVDLPPADLAAAALKDERGGDSRLYFGVNPIAPVEEAIAPWKKGEAPVVVSPEESGDRDIKLSALTPPQAGDAANKPGETIAEKGEVTGEGQRPKSPAERLGLAGAARAKAEKCLANAVYFEARSEPVRGQIAVAQVVMNRTFSPFYPNDVCGVVYQNSHRHLSCQFTFACDGIPDVVTEPDPWARAKHIAKETLDGKLWMPEVAKSTHYHASWVRPNWVREMRKMVRLGEHIFYRPRAWGDGAEEAQWSTEAAIAEAAKPF